MCIRDRATAGPVVALDVLEHDVHRIGWTAQHPDGGLGQGSGQCALLFQRAAGEELDMDGGHGVSTSVRGRAGLEPAADQGTFGVAHLGGIVQGLSLIHI